MEEQDNEIVVNVEFSNRQAENTLDNEVHIISSDIQWEDLELMLQVHADSQNITVFYWDEDNDAVQIDSHNELLEAFKVAKQFQNTLRLRVVRSSDAGTEHSSNDMQSMNEVPSGSSCAKAGKYFYLKSVTYPGNLVLDVQGFGREPGTPVILWDKKPYSSINPEFVCNQLWYEDSHTRTIRSAMNDFCLDSQGEIMVINEYQKDKPSQQLVHVGPYIRSSLQCDEPHVVGVKVADSVSSGCNLCIGPLKSMTGFNWFKEYIDLKTPIQSSSSNLPSWLPSCMSTLRNDIVRDIGCLISSFLPDNNVRQRGSQGFAESGVVHLNTYCDNCNCSIIGVRYKCGYCHNYDLCSGCESKIPPVHDPSHALLKMSLPVNEVKLSRSVVDQILSPSSSFSAQFVRDETIPDGSDVIPGAKLRKIWILRNTGTTTWTPRTTALRLISGTMFVNTSMETPLDCQIAPGQEGPICAELVAPQPAGCYTSHWRLVDTQTQTAFGPVIWCQINVKPTMMTEVVADGPPLAGNGIDVALSTEDLFDFVKTLEKTAKQGNSIRPGPLAVPTNTPLAATPPLYTPVAGLSRVSSSDSVSSLNNEGVVPCNTLELNMTVMADLVQEKMNELSPSKPDENFDNMNTDPCSDDEDSNSSFYVVPIPDCFNTELPPSRLSSTSVVVRKNSSSYNLSAASNDRVQSFVFGEDLPYWSEAGYVTRSVDSNDLASSGFGIGQENYTNDGIFGSTEKEIVPVEAPVDTQISERLQSPATEMTDDEPVASESTCHEQLADSHELQMQPGEAVEQEVRAGLAEDDHLNGNPGDMADRESDNSARNNHPTTNVTSSPPKQSSFEDIAFGLFSSASKIATATINTAKGVFNTMQARNAYIPPQSNWTPTESTWAPPADDSFVPPSDSCDWLPPFLTSPSETATDQVGNRKPMDVLIEMGFANRQLNAELLHRYGDDVDRVVQELLSDANWHGTRH